MVMDFVQGGDFFTLMRKFKRMPEDWVRLYVVEIAMALQHLHDMDVVYRDLKPENILLCGDGHLKVFAVGVCVAALLPVFIATLVVLLLT